jgi:hypothetical protein
MSIAERLSYYVEFQLPDQGWAKTTAAAGVRMAWTIVVGHVKRIRSR